MTPLAAVSLPNAKARSKSIRALRDVGIPWLGRVPSEWQFKRLKYAVAVVNDKQDGAAGELTYTGMENIEPATGRYLPNVTEQTADGLANSFRRDDVLFGKLRPYLAKVYHATDAGICSTEFLVMRPRAVHARYLFYYVLSRPFIGIVDSSTYGVKMPRASWGFIGNLPILLPPLDEQRTIAWFLDRETAKIGELIQKKERLLEVLAEERRTVIHKFVTKGLHDGVALRAYPNTRI